MAKPAPSPGIVLRMIVLAFVALIVLLNVVIAPGQPQRESPALALVAIGSVAIVVGFVLSQM